MHVIWLEIPVTDLVRAKRFYEAVFGHAATDVITQPQRSITIIDGEPTVSLNQTDRFHPSADGSIPYAHVEDLDAALDAVIQQGGAIVEPASERVGLGRFSLVSDSEGNALYLHGAG